MADPSARSDIAGRVVLLIDEDPQVARLVRLSLSGHGPGASFQVLVGSRAQEGLRLAARQKPHVILMETRFSGGDGLMLAGKLMQAPGTSGSLIAFFTDDDRPSHVLQAMQMGAVDYIRKPLEPRRLRARIDDIFARIGRPLDDARGPGAQRLMQYCLRCERDRLSGAFYLRRGSGDVAQLSFREGVLASASYAGLDGFDAFVLVSRFGDWDVRFEEGSVPGLPSSSSYAALAPEPGFGGEVAGADAEERTVLDSGAGGGEPRLPGRASEGASTEPRMPAVVDHDPPTLIEPSTDVDGPSAGRAFQSAAEARVRQRRRSSPRMTPARPAPVAAAPPRGPASRLSRGDVEQQARFTGPLPQVARHDPMRQPHLTGPIRMPPAEPELMQHGSPDPLAASRSARPPSSDFGVAPTIEAAQLLAEEDEHDAEHPEIGFYDEDEPTMQMPATFKPVVDGEPQLVSLESAEPVQVVAPPSAAAAAEAPPTSVGGDALIGWIAAMGSAPLLLVVQNAHAAGALRHAAEHMGLIVIEASSIQLAYTIARQRRPVAIISDSQLPDGAGRELLSALRSDFLVRESPFIMVSGDDLAQQIETSGAPAALGPIMQGLNAALAPRAHLWQQLASGTGGEQSGWVEPLGIGNLLRILGACHFGGRLLLRVGEQRNAEVVLRRGEVCGVTVNAPQATVGPLAMLHLVGYEWQELSLSREAPAGAHVPLGDLATLVETASRQNNVLMQRVYDEGLLIEDVAVDEHALDAYVRTLPATSLDLLLRLKGGESPASLVQSGESNESALKALLSDMRRKSVIRAQSLRVVRVELETSWASFSPRDQSGSGVDVMLPAEGQRPRRRGRRWLVVLLTTIITVGLAAGGYLLYREVVAQRASGGSGGSGSGSGSALKPMMSPTKPVMSPTKPIIKKTGTGAGTAAEPKAKRGTGTGTGR
ncbi:MAG: response regulator [Myxococcales bacterium]|nr:response regulator [Myxococcales bacterium]